jgi:hypothetical protein
MQNSFAGLVSRRLQLPVYVFLACTIGCGALRGSSAFAASNVSVELLRVETLPEAPQQQERKIPDGPPPQVRKIPDGTLPQERKIPDGTTAQERPVPTGPAPREYPVPIATTSFFDYEKPSEDPAGATDALGSAYIPVDSTVYPMVLRLYSMGYLDTAFINMRPYTRRSLLHMLSAAQDRIMADDNTEAEGILVSLQDYVSSEMPGPGRLRGSVYGLDTVYTRFTGIHGQTLRDSFHLGQTIVNDYGRPYQPGFNNITGFSAVAEKGIFSLYVRGEMQHAPSNAGYSQALSAQISTIDQIPYSGFNLNQATIPTGPIGSTNTFALQEAVLSVHAFGHEISGGKSDAWLGPGAGGAMAWSNNAQDIYSFRINRVDPLHIPLLSDLVGPFRYDFFVGSLKGHTDPNSPWVHSEEVSFGPTPNVRIAFQRTVIWGGAGHEPVNLHTFLRSFFSLSDTENNLSSKFTAQDPGARYSDFNFSWRLPFLRRYVTLYADTIAHDDVTPISAPRRAAYRPGIYVSQFPGLPKLDFRVEGVSTDTSTLTSQFGQFNYYEQVQRQGYTNKGFIMGDWIGREAKGGQAWLTYHLSPNEWIQAEYLNKKTPKDFLPGGTTQNQFTVDVVKRIKKDVELNAQFQYEGWKAPIYFPGNGLNKNETITFQVTWFPKLHDGGR